MPAEAHNPVLRTPLTEITPLLTGIDIQLSEKTFCRRLEMNYFNCMQAYGVEKGYDKCSDILDDFKECQHEMKQLWRVQKMLEEHDKQYKQGKISNKYEKSPEPDSYFNIADFNIFR